MIAASGPITNIILAALFFTMSRGGLISDPLLLAAAMYGFWINMFLAAFNMIPIDPLDGAKVFRSSAIMWAVIAVPAIVGTLALMAGLF